MIIKWLGLTTQKSLFKKYDRNKCDFDQNYEESVDSESSNIRSSSDSNSDFFDLKQPKQHSSKEIGSSIKVTDSNTPQENSFGKIIDNERKIMNKSDDQKHNKNKLQIRIKKSRFGIKISQMKCKSPVVSSNRHLLFDKINQCKRRIIKDLAVLRVNSPKNEARSPKGKFITKYK